MEKFIQKRIEEAFEKYRIRNINILHIYKEDNKIYPWYFIVCLSGDKYYRFSNYLEDVKHIVDQFNLINLIKWESNCDGWYLKIGIAFTC